MSHTLALATTNTVANRLFYRCHRYRSQLDAALNQAHASALRTVSGFLTPTDAEHTFFFNGRLVTRHLVPF